MYIKENIENENISRVGLMPLKRLNEIYSKSMNTSDSPKIFVLVFDY